MTSTTPSFGPVAVERDELGYWFHPGVPWDLIPEETNSIPYFKAWGYDMAFISLEDDAPQEVADNYFEHGSADISAWNPASPHGEGWFLIAIYDNEDGPQAAYARPLQPEGEKAA